MSTSSRSSPFDTQHRHRSAPGTQPNIPWPLPGIACPATASLCSRRQCLGQSHGMLQLITPHVWERSLGRLPKWQPPGTLERFRFSQLPKTNFQEGILLPVFVTHPFLDLLFASAVPYVQRDLHHHISIRCSRVWAQCVGLGSSSVSGHRLSHSSTFVVKMKRAAPAGVAPGLRGRQGPRCAPAPRAGSCR